MRINKTRTASKPTRVASLHKQRESPERGNTEEVDDIEFASARFPKRPRRKISVDSIAATLSSARAPFNSRPTPTPYRNLIRTSLGPPPPQLAASLSVPLEPGESNSSSSSDMSREFTGAYRPAYPHLRLRGHLYIYRVTRA